MWQLFKKDLIVTRLVRYFSALNFGCLLPSQPILLRCYLPVFSSVISAASPYISSCEAAIKTSRQTRAILLLSMLSDFDPKAKVVPERRIHSSKVQRHSVYSPVCPQSVCVCSCVCVKERELKNGGKSLWEIIQQKERDKVKFFSVEGILFSRFRFTWRNIEYWQLMRQDSLFVCWHYQLLIMLFIMMSRVW